MSDFHASRFYTDHSLAVSGIELSIGTRRTVRNPALSGDFSVGKMVDAPEVEFGGFSFSRMGSDTGKRSAEGPPRSRYTKSARPRYERA